MKRQWLVFLATIGLFMNAMTESNGANPGPLAGWLGLFPQMDGYQRTFTAPVVTADKDKKPVAYRQTVKYEWTGGDIRLFEVTLARDPAFKQKYAAETLRKEPKPPSEVKVGKRTAWLWQDDKAKPGAVANRLVVPLAEDKALIVEDKSGRKEILLDLAERLDLAKMTAALDAPPRTDAKRGVEVFRALKKGMPYTEVEAWVGMYDKADKEAGSGTLVFEYKLPDGGRVLLGFTKIESLTYARYENKDGKVEELAK